MKSRLLFLLRLFITLLLIFATQKVVFMLVNIGHAEGAPFGQCAAAIWHGMRLDTVAAAYILIIPTLTTLLTLLFEPRSQKAESDFDASATNTLTHSHINTLFKVYFVIAAILMALAFAADVVLYYFWGAKIDANDLIYAAKPKEMLASLQWWAIPIGALAIGLLVWHYIRRLFHTMEIRTKTEAMRSRWYALLYIPLAALIFLGMRGGISESTANPSYAYFSKHQFCNHAALNPLFNIIHSMFKTEDLENRFVYYDDNEVDEFTDAFFATDGNITDTLLTNPQPNILLIVWESGGSNITMVDSVAPNLNRYADEGVYFSNCYANNFRTDRGLVSLLSGWMGLPTTSLMKMSEKCAQLPSLASSFARRCYETRFVYGGDVDFTNMRGYLLETGYQTVEGSEAFPHSRSKSSWGAPDAYTLLPSVLADGHTTSQTHPFFTTILTLSSHEPWTVPMQRLSDSRQNAFAYTDSCIGVLVDSLRNMPIWDNLLIIITPDHGVPLSASQSTSDPSVAHIPMVWTGGAVRGHKTVDAMMMQSDIAATLLAQTGLSASHFPFSRNVLSPRFSDSRPMVLHCFKNGCNLIDSTGITRFECADGNTTVVGGNPSGDHPQIIKMLLQYTYRKTAGLSKLKTENGERKAESGKRKAESGKRKARLPRQPLTH